MFPVIDEIRQRATSLSKRIVYPNPRDARVLEAVGVISRLGIAHPILLGDKTWIDKELRRRGLSGGDVEVVGLDSSKTSRYVEILLEVLRGQGVRETELRQKLKDPNEYAVAMVRAGDADGLVVGPDSRAGQNELAGTLGLKFERSRPCRCFLVALPPGGRWSALLFACGIAMATPRPHELAEIALEASRCSRELFQRESRMGFLALSIVASLERRNRFESAFDLLQDRVKQTIATLQARDSGLAVDRQLHISFPADGSSNTYVFADSQPGDLRNRLARSFEGSRVVGPILRGLNTPANRLGAGCTVEDVIDVSAITVLS